MYINHTMTYRCTSETLSGKTDVIYDHVAKKREKINACSIKLCCFEGQNEQRVTLTAGIVIC